MIRLFALLGIAAGAFTASIAQAETFQVVTAKERFVQAVAGAELTRMGITLNVEPNGQITGKAFGKPVKGAWKWSGGYFCRDLAWGERDLGYNCQQVQQNGATLRFTSDKGSGRSADLTLR